MYAKPAFLKAWYTSLPAWAYWSGCASSDRSGAKSMMGMPTCLSSAATVMVTREVCAAGSFKAVRVKTQIQSN